ncbi:MAG TPA: GIY-YIG nuclease family protein [Ginsengibacter sp.]|nr:GIY-YIG nuclease family protein [Ginsengibacter sp.]HRP43233.1 GIY-YIG nuclease family protein [Ginsengibacter sp.]
MFDVYILYSQKFDRYYIGQTGDIAERLKRHNAGYEKATSPYVPWILICKIEKTSRREAIILEKKLKNLNRKRLIAFIQKYGKQDGG